MNHRKLFNDKDELESSLINQINLMIEKNKSKNFIQIENLTFEKEILKLNLKTIIIQM